MNLLFTGMKLNKISRDMDLLWPISQVQKKAKQQTPLHPAREVWNYFNTISECFDTNHSPPQCDHCIQQHHAFPHCSECTNPRQVFPNCLECMDTRHAYPTCSECKNPRQPFPDCEDATECINPLQAFPMCSECINLYDTFPDCSPGPLRPGGTGWSAKQIACNSYCYKYTIDCL